MTIDAHFVSRNVLSVSYIRPTEDLKQAYNIGKVISLILQRKKLMLKVTSGSVTVDPVEPGFEPGKLGSTVSGCTQLPVIHHTWVLSARESALFPAILFESKAHHLCGSVVERKNI